MDETITPNPASNDREGQPNIDQVVESMYGPAGLEYFNEIAAEEPNLTQEEWFKILEANPTPTDSRWFREPNVAATGEVLMPLLVSEGRQHLNVASVGSSYGHEVFSVAAAALSAGVTDFSITGFDVNDEAVAMANNPDATLRPPAVKRIPDRFAPYLDRTPDGLRAGTEIRSRVGFQELDVIDHAVPGQFDVVLARNILPHYPEATRRRIMNHILDAVAPGGYVVLEAMPDMIRGSIGHPGSFEPYWLWRRDAMLQEFPQLEQVQVGDDTHNFFRKVPAQSSE